MQLTKDDFIIDSKFGRRGLDYSKFLKVRAFYDEHKTDLNSDLELYEHYKYPDRDLSEKLQKEYLKCPNGLSFKDWLFNYCFVEGLK